MNVCPSVRYGVHSVWRNTEPTFPTHACAIVSDIKRDSRCQARTEEMRKSLEEQIGGCHLWDMGLDGKMCRRGSYGLGMRREVSFRELSNWVPGGHEDGGWGGPVSSTLLVKRGAYSSQTQEEHIQICDTFIGSPYVIQRPYHTTQAHIYSTQRLTGISGPVPASNEDGETTIRCDQQLHQDLASALSVWNFNPILLSSAKNIDGSQPSSAENKCWQGNTSFKLF